MLTFLGLRYLFRKLNLSHLIAPRTTQGAKIGVSVSMSVITISVLTLYVFTGITDFAVLVWMSTLGLIYSVALFIGSLEQIYLYS